MKIRVAYYGNTSSIGTLKKEAKDFIENELPNAEVTEVDMDANYVFADSKLRPVHAVLVTRLHPGAIIRWV